MTKNEDLKACPFCGGVAVSWIPEWTDEPYAMCGMGQPLGSVPCFGKVSGGTAKMWNARPTVTPTDNDQRIKFMQEMGFEYEATRDEDGTLLEHIIMHPRYKGLFINHTNLLCAMQRAVVGLHVLGQATGRTPTDSHTYTNPKNGEVWHCTSSTTDGDAERALKWLKNNIEDQIGIARLFGDGANHEVVEARAVCETIRTALRTRTPPYSGDLNNAEYEIMKKRVEHYKNENIALRKQTEIFKAANKDELQ